MKQYPAACALPKPQTTTTPNNNNNNNNNIRAYHDTYWTQRTQFLFVDRGWGGAK